jgi:hypothetical protein
MPPAFPLFVCVYSIICLSLFASILLRHLVRQRLDGSGMLLYNEIVLYRS